MVDLCALYRPDLKKSGDKVACSLDRKIGGDSPFFALLGPAPQELNDIRPGAKLELKIARTKSKQIFYSALAVETPLPASGSRSTYSHDYFVDTPRSTRVVDT
jgi:hypothetical protein